MDLAVARWGKVSGRRNGGCAFSPYEPHLNFFDALNDPEHDDPPPAQAARFEVSQSIDLCLAGIPGIYIHSLVGSRGNRQINRGRLPLDMLPRQLLDPSMRRGSVFGRLSAHAAGPLSPARLSPHGLAAIPGLRRHDLCRAARGQGLGRNGSRAAQPLLETSLCGLAQSAGGEPVRGSVGIGEYAPGLDRRNCAGAVADSVAGDFNGHEVAMKNGTGKASARRIIHIQGTIS